MWREVPVVGRDGGAVSAAASEAAHAAGPRTQEAVESTPEERKVAS